MVCLLTQDAAGCLPFQNACQLETASPARQWVLHVNAMLLAGIVTWIDEKMIGRRNLQAIEASNQFCLNPLNLKISDSEVGHEPLCTGDTCESQQ